MDVTSKSPRAVLVTALQVAQASLPAYCHKPSPKKFTQHQLFACLVLKNFLKTDYRGVVNHLKDCPSLAESIDLKKIPHYTTLQKASERLLVSRLAQRLLDETVDIQMGRRTVVPDSAIDSTGLRRQKGTGGTIFSREQSASRGGSPIPWRVSLSSMSRPCASNDALRKIARQHRHSTSRRSPRPI